jgi:CDP-diacylglycerol--glycerol-3-phosphate 3-phosphatidyltransferase
MKQLPNILTGLRLVLSILMFAALVAIRAGILGAPMSPQVAVFLLWFALAAFIIAAITDYLDGWLARRWQVVSVLGAILDPIADKILVCGAILGLIGVGMSPDVVAFSGIILFREFAVSALREVLAPRGIKLPVTLLAKLKTSLQLVSIGALMVMKFWPAWGINARIDHLRTAMEAAELLYGLAAAVTLWTGLEYGRSAWLALQAQPEE